MKKKMIALVLTAAFTVASAVAVSAFTCEVTAIDGTTVTLECSEKNLAKLEVGKKADLKAKRKKKKVVEGC